MPVNPVISSERQSSAFETILFSVVRVESKFTRSIHLETAFPMLRDAWTRPLPLYAVITFQAVTSADMTQWSENASVVKEGSLHVFTSFVQHLRRQLQQQSLKQQLTPHDAPSHRATVMPTDDQQLPPLEGGEGDERVAEDVWVNAGDPASGWPLFGHRGSTTYDEVGGLEEFIRVEKVQISTQWGSCNIATHPKFGVDVYPATAFVAAPEALMLAVLAQL